jgi:hypothetical protein
MVRFSTQRRKDAKKFCCGGGIWRARQRQNPFPKISFGPGGDGLLKLTLSPVFIVHPLNW